MCLYPRLIENRKYRPSIKNMGIVPVLKDERMKYIPAKCGKCMECRQEKARDWSVRLYEELQVKFGYFVTLTFSDEALYSLLQYTGLTRVKGNENTIAKTGFRLFLERVRKETGQSVKHWFVTELGEDRGRIHLHGILFDQKAVEYMRKNWKYGNTFVGDYCNLRTVRYITKYMLKKDVKHPKFEGIVLSSAGIGAAYIKRINIKEKRERAHIDRTPAYIWRDGRKCKLPKYYVDKIFTDEDREEMWTRTLDTGITWIHGEKVHMDDESTIENLRNFYKAQSKAINFDDEEEWEKQKKEKQLARWREVRAMTRKKREALMAKRKTQHEKRLLAYHNFEAIAKGEEPILW